MTSTSVYRGKFFSERDSGTRHNAERVLGLIPLEELEVSSAADIGCGVGTWLSVLMGRGVTDVTGVDGPWVGRENLVIPPESFQERDLTRGFDLGRRFDLVISIEVGEHLAPEYADHFVSDLCRHGDLVLFSAAIPYQGGVRHVNEQWPSYWADRFAAHGYRPFDLVRPALWEETGVPVWFKQATFAYAAQGTQPCRLLEERVGNDSRFPLDVVHPSTLRRHIEQPGSVHRAAKTFWRAASRSLRFRAGKVIGRKR